MSLDPDSFRSEPVNVCWRSFNAPGHGGFDIATPAGEDGGPERTSLAHLEKALADIDRLFEVAITAAEKGWAARYNGPLRSREAWSIVRIHANTDGRITFSLHEAEFDTYCLWDVTLVDGRVSGVDHRDWVAVSG